MLNISANVDPTTADCGFAACVVVRLPPTLCLLNYSLSTRRRACRLPRTSHGLTDDGRKLEVVVAQVATSAGRFKGMKFTFDLVTGFRFLDEGDLLRYWRSEGYRGGHHLFSVEAGGWAEEEFKLEGVTEKRREWLVVTGNGCMNVFAHDAPEILHGEFDDACITSRCIGSPSAPAERRR